jgi:hypothetical protein
LLCSELINDIFFVETGKMHAAFWWEDLRGRDHFEDLGVDGRIILK